MKLFEQKYQHKSIILSLTALVLFAASLFLSCKTQAEYNGDILAVINEDSSTVVSFKKDLNSPVAFTQKYTIGKDYTVKDLPGNDNEKVDKLNPGFELVGWKVVGGNFEMDKSFTLDENGYVKGFHMGTTEITFYGGGYTASTDTPYKIVYKTQNITMDGYDYYSEQAMTGTTSTPEAPSYTDAANNLIEIPGFTAQTAAIEEQEIAADGSAVVEVLYNRNSYTLTVHSNEGGSVTEALDTQDFYYGVPAQLNPNAFTRAGCSFAGWATTRERAAAGTVDYTDGANYTIGIGNADLYAVWTLPHISVTISLPGADEVGVTYDPPAGNSITLKAVIPVGHTASEYTYKWFHTNAGPGTLLNTDSSASSYVLDTTGWAPGYYQITLIAELGGVPAGGGTLQIQVQ